MMHKMRLSIKHINSPLLILPDVTMKVTTSLFKITHQLPHAHLLHNKIWNKIISFKAIHSRVPINYAERQRAAFPQIEDNSTEVIPHINVSSQQKRKVTEIRVFYDDQTWEAFVPKNKGGF